MAGSEEVISEILKTQGIKKDRDVEELYLTNRNLTDVHDLQRYRYLKILWLNNNLLQRVTCLQHTLRLRELYLHDNQLVEIQGAVGHLAALEILTLHNNQLTRLEACLTELAKISNLRILNLFNNPLAQEPDYRLFVVKWLPTVELLDRHAVIPEERHKAHRLFGPGGRVQDTIAFGRRSLGPPKIFFPATKLQRGSDLKEAGALIGNSYLRNRAPFESVDEAFDARRKMRATTVFSFFDWSKVPKLEQRRQLRDPFKTPEMVTCVFR